jgi:hypothetical protein
MNDPVRFRLQMLLMLLEATAQQADELEKELDLNEIELAELDMPIEALAHGIADEICTAVLAVKNMLDFMPELAR